MTRVQYQGRTLDDRTEKMLREANRLLGHPLTLSQGCYNAGSVSASAGTHDGGGVMDVHVKGQTMKEKLDIVRTLRKVGFAAWYRPTIGGLWTEHVHAVAVGCKDLAPSAARQVEELRDGGDGLKGGSPDPHRDMDLPVISWEHYLESLKPKPAPPKQRATDVHKPGSRVLREGDRGTDVAYVQAFIDSRLTEDGVFGPVTAKAVAAYRRMRGLSAGSVVDKKMWEAIL